MVSGSTPRRIQPLRKQIQLRAIEGLRQSHGTLPVGRSVPLRQECCVGFASEAGVAAARHGPRMRLSHLPSAGKVVWRYRGTGEASFPTWDRR
jgi:hypothetical protein